MLGQFFLTEDLQVYKTTTRSHILQKKIKIPVEDVPFLQLQESLVHGRFPFGNFHKFRKESQNLQI